MTFTGSKFLAARRRSEGLRSTVCMLAECLVSRARQPFRSFSNSVCVFLLVFDDGKKCRTHDNGALSRDVDISKPPLMSMRQSPNQRLSLFTRGCHRGPEGSPSACLPSRRVVEALTSKQCGVDAYLWIGGRFWENFHWLTRTWWEPFSA